MLGQDQTEIKIFNFLLCLKLNFYKELKTFFLLWKEITYYHLTLRKKYYM